MKYRAIYSIESKLAFNGLILKVNNSPYIETLRLLDDKLHVNGKYYSTGKSSAIIDFKDGTPLKIVEDNSFSLLEQILSKFSFITRSHIKIRSLILIFDISQNTLVRWFRQYENIPSLVEASRSVTDPEILTVLERDEFQSSSPKINRAIRWYWKGLNEKDPLDAFLNFWIGLESINVSV